METTVLYLIRHCEPDQSVEDDLSRPLTSQGREQALRVTECLKDKNISAVYSSDARRTLDTIGDFARHSGLPVQTDIRLREGTLGCPKEENPIHSKRQWEDLGYRLPGGESLSQVQERVGRCIEELLKKHNGEQIVVCTHGTAICSFINSLCPEFGWEETKAVKRRWPWILRFEFEGEGRFAGWEEVDF